MKYYIAVLILLLVSSAYAIKVGDVPIINKGIKIGYNTGLSYSGGGIPVATYWDTAMTARWDTPMTALWDTTMDTEIP